MRRWWTMLLMLTLLVGCGAAAEDPLAYQDGALTVEAIFTLDGTEMPGTLELSAAEFDAEGRMLARDARLTLRDNSIIAGVQFEITGGEAFVASGVLKIPLSDETVIGGILDLVSLFCIDGGSYYAAEDAGECRLYRYVNGENRVELLYDPNMALPKEITAVIDSREIGAKIESITSP